MAGPSNQEQEDAGGDRDEDRGIGGDTWDIHFEGYVEAAWPYSIQWQLNYEETYYGEEPTIEPSEQAQEQYVGEGEGIARQGQADTLCLPANISSGRILKELKQRFPEWILYLPKPAPAPGNSTEHIEAILAEEPTPAHLQYYRYPASTTERPKSWPPSTTPSTSRTEREEEFNDLLWDRVRYLRHRLPRRNSPSRGRGRAEEFWSDMAEDNAEPANSTLARELAERQRPWF